MAAEAHVSSLWRKQKLFISLFFIGIGLYFFYDGLIGYPRSNERFDTHKSFVDKSDEPGWRTFARSKGWKEQPPKKHFGPGDIVEQYVCGGISTALGILLLVYWYTQRERSLRTDEEAVYTPSGTRVPFDAITGVGKKKWESKGLATVRYEVQGRKRQFIVDDYKFEMEPTHKILAEIEERLLARSGEEAKAEAAPPAEPSERTLGDSQL